MPKNKKDDIVERDIEELEGIDVEELERIIGGITADPIDPIDPIDPTSPRVHVPACDNHWAC